jgi:hypothetical protein
MYIDKADLISCVWVVEDIREADAVFVYHDNHYAVALRDIPKAGFDQLLQHLRERTPVPLKHVGGIFLSKIPYITLQVYPACSVNNKP